MIPRSLQPYGQRKHGISDSISPLCSLVGGSCWHYLDITSLKWIPFFHRRTDNLGHPIDILLGLWVISSTKKNLLHCIRLSSRRFGGDRRFHQWNRRSPHVDHRSRHTWWARSLYGCSPFWMGQRLGFSCDSGSKFHGWCTFGEWFLIIVYVYELIQATILSSCSAAMFC